MVKAAHVLRTVVKTALKIVQGIVCVVLPR
jgi:hypothetical protein